jgi:hypothetical protein
METRPGRFRALLLALVLTIGAGAVWALAILLVAATIMGLYPKTVASPGINQELLLLANGTPVIKTGERDESGDIIVDLHHKPIPKNARFLPASRLDATNQISSWAWMNRVYQLNRIDKRFGRWYLMYDGEPNGHAYFVGYDDETYGRIGYIGRNGFQTETPATDEQFTIGYADATALWTFLYASDYSIDVDRVFEHPQQPELLDRSFLFKTDDGLMKIDFENHTVKPYWKDATLISVASSIKEIKPPTGDTDSPRVALAGILLRMPDRVIELNYEGKEVARFILPEQFRSRSFDFALLPNKQAIIQTAPKNNELFWIDPAGKIIRHENVDLVHEDAKWYVPLAYRAAEKMMNAFLIPSPGGIVVTLACNPWDFWAELRRNSPEYLPTLRQALVDVQSILAINGVLAVLLAALCWHRQRKYGLSWTWAWVAFVLVFGLPAYFGYWAHRVWPARLACPSCGRRVPRDRPACFICHAAFPPPDRKGIEVFA